MKTLAKVFGKFGKDLGYDVNKDNRISFINITYTRAINIAKAVTIKQDPFQNTEKV